MVYSQHSNTVCYLPEMRGLENSVYDYSLFMGFGYHRITNLVFFLITSLSEFLTVLNSELLGEPK